MWTKINEHPRLSAAFVASFLLVAVGWAWAIVRLRGIQQPLILHYNGRAGITYTGNLTELGAIGLLGLVMVALNFSISLELERRDWFWGKFVAAATLTLAILIFITFAAIITVN